MLVSDFEYVLPPELIAQAPLARRDHSRLLVLERQTQRRFERRFDALGTLLNPGDLLIFNDTRVIPARLFARKERSDGAKVEIFLLKQVANGEWECLVRPGRRVRPGTRLLLAEGMTAQVIAAGEDGSRRIQFDLGIDFHDWLERHGDTPLPPYIRTRLDQPERYQTVYARHEGSVAAPTAGLHFTPELLKALKEMGVQTGFLTLHVGLGTFRPVQVDRVEDHRMHAERFTVSEELVAQVASTRAGGGRIIAVGTTVVRVLESQSGVDGRLQPGTGETAIFIYPGYRFKVIDGLITNFHLPGSTLLMLVAAFAGREWVLDSYRYAVTERFRFFSFGDAMFIS